MEIPKQGDQDLITAESLSCKICRRRKIKCDKKHPCTSCLRSNLDCVFPQGRRRPTHGRNSRDTELLTRLKHFESELEALRTSLMEKNSEDQAKTSSPAASQKSPADRTTPNATAPVGSQESPEKSIVADFGHLDIRKGRSRYTSNALWASLSQEISDMRELLDEDSTEDDNSSPPYFQLPPKSWPGHSAFVPGFASNDFQTAPLHPTEDQMLKLWTVFERNVLPVVKIFHGPTTKHLFQTAATGAEAISALNEPTFFSIYYAAIISLTADACQDLFGESRVRLLKKYRHALEQALWRVDFLNSSALSVLQAFILFALCTRRHDDTRLIVSWCATAITIAKFLGLHRDGSKFGLDPFQTELRRRVWWQLVLLDTDSSRDHGIDPLLHESSFDTQIPLNLADDDLAPDMPTPDHERQGFTDMTNFIVRCEVSIVYCRLSYTPPRPHLAQGGVTLQTTEDKETLVKQLQTRLDESYLQHCDYTNSLQFATAVYIRSMCAMFWSIIYHPLQRDPETFSQDMHDRLFASMVEVIENTRLLECSPATAQWGWYFHNDVQWSAIAYVLNELLTRPTGPSLRRAWAVVHAARRQWDADSSPLQKGMLWRAVRSMTTKAGLFDDMDGAKSTNLPAAMAQAGPVSTEQVPELPLLSSLPIPQTNTAPPVEEMQNEMDASPRQLQEDPWLLLEDELRSLHPDTSLATCDLNEKGSPANLGTIHVEDIIHDSNRGQSNSWWSMINEPAGPGWIT